METQIFTWKRNGYSDQVNITFYDVELIVDVGKYSKGTKFAYVYTNYYEDATMEFYASHDDHKPVMTCRVKIQLEVQ